MGYRQVRRIIVLIARSVAKNQQAVSSCAAHIPLISSILGGLKNAQSPKLRKSARTLAARPRGEYSRRAQHQKPELARLWGLVTSKTISRTSRTVKATSGLKLSAQTGGASGTQYSEPPDESKLHREDDMRTPAGVLLPPSDQSFPRQSASHESIWDNWSDDAPHDFYQTPASSQEDAAHRTGDRASGCWEEAWNEVGTQEPSAEDDVPRLDSGLWDGNDLWVADGTGRDEYTCQGSWDEWPEAEYDDWPHHVEAVSAARQENRFDVSDHLDEWLAAGMLDNETANGRCRGQLEFDESEVHWMAS